MGSAIAAWRGLFERRWVQLSVTGWLGLSLIQLTAFHSVRADDAYITYRYGQNLAEGFGLVFNPSQRVQGSTSPAHMLLSALIYAGFGRAATPAWMAAIGCAAWSAQTIALQRLLSAALGPLGAALIALAIGLGMSGAAAWVPLETNLVAAFVLFAFVLGRERRWSAAAISAGLAVFVRPDAALPAALVLGTCCIDLRWRALRPLALFSAIALPWPLFATWYYGNPIPQTAVTKFQRVGLGDYALHELNHPSARLLWPAAGGVWTGLALALVLIGGVRLIRRDVRLTTFVAYGYLHALAYLVLRPFMQHTWHLYPWTLVFCVCGLGALLPAPASAARPTVLPPMAALARLQAGATALLLITSSVRFARECDTLAGGYWTGQRDTVYREIAGWLGQHASAKDWFASIEVGTIAYYSGLPAYDLGGLVTGANDALADHPVRFIVVDKAYLMRAPPSVPVFSARSGEFWANVYEPSARQRP